MESNSPRVLGEGSYGCVMQPAIECVGKETPFGKRKNTKAIIVGKVFDSRADYQAEVRASKKIAKIDPQGTHILVPTSHCHTNLANVDMHPAAKDCEIIQYMRFASPATKLYQIKMPYGGQRYDKYIKRNNVGLRELVQHIIHVLEGVQKLQKHAMCHQDIKSGNLLISASGQVMIIDYSLMAKYDEVYVKKNIRRLKHTYFPYPPEYKMFYLVYNRICNQQRCDTLLPMIMKNLDHYGSDRLQKMLILHKDMSEDVATFYQHMLKNQHRLPELFLPYVKKMDVYSVGALIVDLDHHIDKKGISLESMRAYYDTVAGMTIADPRKRLTVSQALKKFKAIR